MHFSTVQQFPFMVNYPEEQEEHSKGLAKHDIHEVDKSLEQQVPDGRYSSEMQLVQLNGLFY